MSISKIELTKSWRNASDFPTYESSETQVREDLQCLFDEIAAYINNTLTEAVDALSATVDTAVANAMNKAAGPENLLTGDLYFAKNAPHIILIDDTDPNARKIGEIGIAADGKLRFNMHPEGAGSLGGLVFQNEAENFNQSIQLFENPTTEGGTPQYWTFLTNRNTPAVAQVISGTYVGTGTYGVGNETGLPVTVPFTPKLVMIWDSTGTTKLAHPLLFGIDAATQSPVAITQTYKLDGVTNTGAVDYSAAEPNVVKWHHADSAENQLNASGVTYCYVVLGNGEVQ